METTTLLVVVAALLIAIVVNDNSVDSLLIPYDGRQRFQCRWGGTLFPRSSASSRTQEHHPPTEERTVVIAYHKPPQTVTSHSDADSSRSNRERQTVYDDILSMKGYVGEAKDGTKPTFQEVTGCLSMLHAVGRLDAETTGLLLLTNDGGLVHHLTNPTASSHGDSLITKTYEATIMGYHDDKSMGIVTIRTDGVDIGSKYGGMTKPAVDLQILGHPTAKSTLVSITIAEGKNRQVRRMFHSIQSGVMKLKRTAIGGSLTIEERGLKEGQWNVLTDDEVETHLGWAPRIISREANSKNLSRSKTKRSRKQIRKT